MMNTADAFSCAFENLAQHKLRSALTMLGMMFGVGAVIAMLSIGAGAERRAMELIDTLGVRNVVIRSIDFEEDELKEVRKKSLGLSRRDVDAIIEAIPGAEIVAPRSKIEPYMVLSATGKSESNVAGVSYSHRTVVELAVNEGRFFDTRDERTHAQVCVLGAGARRDLFGGLVAVGRDVKVNGVWFEVVGVLASDAGGARIEGVAVSSTDQMIYVPFTTALRKFDFPPLKSPLDEIIVRTSGSVSPRDTAAITAGLLDRLHGGAADYEIIVPQKLLDQSRQTQQLFNIVMGCIAGISLLVGGIGIMNIMLASVLEQTREIGIRRAVGARRQDIRFQFLVSAFSLSVLGGIIGIATGLGIARVVAAYAGWPTIVTMSSIVLSTGVSVVVGLVSGLYPAVRAARLEPVEALRYE